VTHAPGSRPWGRAFAWGLFLGALFFTSYGWANALAAERGGALPTLAYPWEAAIPFVPWTIVPYWSIDLFYAVSLFVCLDRRELDRHALRLLTAQVVAVACFVAWPLRCSFVRQSPEGVFGALFAALHGFDQPYNQAPSLHIVLLVILWLRFGAHLRSRAARWALHAWAALIAVSVLTTYQHHFVDIPTGMLLGFLCAWAWPMRMPPPWRTATPVREPARWRLAAAYAVGAAAFIALAIALRGWAWWLLWPAVSLAGVALAYAWLGPAAFQKEADGRLTVAAAWLFAPYLLAAWLNSRWWTRREPAPVEVADGVWLGRMPGGRDATGFAAVVDCSAELPSPRNVPVAAVPMLDLVAPPTRALRDAADAIERARAADGKVLVCCALGYSRSAAAVAAWLRRSGREATLDAALGRVRAARAAIVLTATHHAALADATADA
jgi:membrane-associated phospholipid phosphatase